MTTQEIYQEIQGLIDLLKKEGKAAWLRKILLTKMYDTDSSDLEILEEVETDLTAFFSDKSQCRGFEVSLKTDHILFEIENILSKRRKTERRTSPQVVVKQ